MIADSLAAIDSPLTDRQLYEYTLSGLDGEYDTFHHAPSLEVILPDLRSKLILFEQRLRRLRDSSSYTTPPTAFATLTADSSQSGSPQTHLMKVV